MLRWSNQLWASAKLPSLMTELNNRRLIWLGHVTKMDVSHVRKQFMAEWRLYDRINLKYKDLLVIYVRSFYKSTRSEKNWLKTESHEDKLFVTAQYLLSWTWGPNLRFKDASERKLDLVAQILLSVSVAHHPNVTLTESAIDRTAQQDVLQNIRLLIFAGLKSFH